MADEQTVLSTDNSIPQAPPYEWRGFLTRSVVFPWCRKYNLLSRAHFITTEFRECLRGQVLDVGAGSTAPYFRKELGDSYHALDLGESYQFSSQHIEPTAPQFTADLEHESLPFQDKSFDTVMCIGCLEHLDNIYHTYDELFRVTRKYVIIQLPNNWVRLLGSFLIGHHVAHLTGYGLPPHPKPPGQRHKYFFNLEEACDFLAGRMPEGFSVRRFEPRFTLRHDGLRQGFPAVESRLFCAQRRPLRGVLEQYGRLLGIGLWLGVKLTYKALQLLDTTISALVWGWGSRVRFYNMFCYEVWMVFERKEEGCI